MRSGDHPTFARLVFAIAPGRDWDLARDGTGYALSIDGADGFDPSEVFDRITRSRIAGLRVASNNGSNGLTIDLACDCHADAFLWRPDRLVVDIVDGPAPDDSPFEPSQTTALAAPAADPPSGQMMPSILPVVFGLQDPLRPIDGMPIGPTPRGAIADPTSDHQTAPHRPDSFVAATEAALMSDLAAAVELGMIEMGSDRTAPVSEGDPHSDPEHPDTTDNRPGSEPVPGHATQTGAVPGLASRTAVVELPSTGPLTGACPPGDAYDVPSWTDPSSDFSTQLGHLRAQLFSENGAPDGMALVSLSRLYVAHGLGREAAQLLTLVEDTTTPDIRALAVMTAVVEGEPVPAAAITGCTGAAQLWSALATGGFAAMSSADKSAALAAFAVLPAPAKGRIGPALASILAAAGDTAGAGAVLTGTMRSPAADLVETAAAETELTLVADGPERASALADEIIGTEETLSPEAVVTAIDLALRTGRPVTVETISLAQALRFEHRGTEVAARLASAEIRAHLAANRFDVAFALLSEMQPTLGPERMESLFEEATLAISERGSQSDFLGFAFAPFAGPVAPAAVNSVAARLLDLGFAERAADLLAEPVVGAALAQRVALRARADQAITEDAAEPELAQAEAHAASADPSVEPRAEPDPTAWQRGDWAELGGMDDPLLRRAAEAAQAAPFDLGTGAPLAARRAMLVEAEGTRALVNDLLSRFEIDPEPGAIATD